MQAGSTQAGSTQAGSGHGAQGARRAPASSSAHPCPSRFNTRLHDEQGVRRRTGSDRNHDTARVVGHGAHSPHSVQRSYGGYVGAGHDARHATTSAGDPVRLGPAFFQTGEAGGVGRDPAVYTISRRLIVIGPGHPPPSAAREAARRGLGRE